MGCIKSHVNMIVWVKSVIMLCYVPEGQFCSGRRLLHAFVQCFLPKLKYNKTTEKYAATEMSSKLLFLVLSFGPKLKQLQKITSK